MTHQCVYWCLPWGGGTMSQLKPANRTRFRTKPGFGIEPSRWYKLMTKVGTRTTRGLAGCLSDYFRGSCITQCTCPAVEQKYVQQAVLFNSLVLIEKVPQNREENIILDKVMWGSRGWLGRIQVARHGSGWKRAAGLSFFKLRPLLSPLTSYF